MDSFMFAVGVVMPIICMVAVGYALGRTGFMPEKFSTLANTLVFRVFLPAMLFLNVYKIESIDKIEPAFILYALGAEAVIILLSFAAVALFCKVRNRKGVLIQAAFRSNYALIGIPLAEAMAGEAGVAAASLLSVVFVPAINVISVIVLSVYGHKKGGIGAKRIFFDVLKNPLIISVLAGVACLFVRSALASCDIAFRISDITPIYYVIENLAAMATPMALLVLGARFEFSAVRALRREIIFGTLMRTVIAPTLGIGAALLLFGTAFEGAHYAAFVCAFATPVAVASAPMSQEMGGDGTLAGQLVVWTTVVSAFTLFVLSYILSAAGVF